MIRTILSVIGGLVFFLWLMGALGIGHFYLYYGPDNIPHLKLVKEELRGESHD